jgi:hypothetical protein
LNIPYIALTQSFEYDDILRKPIDYVLTKFRAGGSQLIATWFAFGISALLFIPASILLHRLIDPQKNSYPNPYLTIFTAMGILSGILQSIGLLRWVFVIPILANLYIETPNPVTKEAVQVVYLAVHQYGGVVIGEYLGQTLLIGWTVGIGLGMLRSPLFKPWVAWFGLFTTPLLFLGQSELLSTVIPTLPVLESTPIGFILWEVWLLIVGISLLRVSKSKINLSL